MRSFNSDGTLIAHAQLLKAHVARKNHLINQINEIHIKSNYIQLSQYMKNTRELAHVSKNSIKKHREIKVCIEALTHANSNCRVTITLPHPDLLSNQTAFPKRNAVSFGLLVSLIDSDVIKLETTRQKYAHIYTKFQGLREKYRSKNQQIIKFNENLEVANEFGEEANNIKEKIYFLSRTNKELSVSLMFRHKLKLTNIRVAKLFSQLPENKLTLRSKILLKDELKSIIEKSFKEIKYYEKSLLREKTLMEEIEKRAQTPRRQHIKSLDTKHSLSKLAYLELKHLSPRGNSCTSTSMGHKQPELNHVLDKSTNLSEMRARLNSELEIKLTNLNSRVNDSSRTPIHLELSRLSSRLYSNCSTPLSLSLPKLSLRFNSDTVTPELTTAKISPRINSASMDIQRARVNPQKNSAMFSHINSQLVKPGENQGLSSYYKQQRQLSLDITDSSSDSSKIFIFDELYSFKQYLIEQSSTVKNSLSRILDNLD